MKILEDPIPEGHPSQETRQQRGNDFLLRKHGFVIYSRPNSGAPLWKWQGRLYTEPDAVKLVKGIK